MQNSHCSGHESEPYSKSPSQPRVDGQKYPKHGVKNHLSAHLQGNNQDYGSAPATSNGKMKKGKEKSQPHLIEVELYRNSTLKQ